MNSTRSPLELDLARVARVDAGEHLHQRALAGAVLAHQRMNLAREQAEVDRVQRPDAAERLVDAAHLENAVLMPSAHVDATGGRGGDRPRWRRVARL